MITIPWVVPPFSKGIAYKTSDDCDASRGHYCWEGGNNPTIPFKCKTQINHTGGFAILVSFWVGLFEHHPFLAA